jgi:hypothetical protein
MKIIIYVTFIFEVGIKRPSHTNGILDQEIDKFIVVTIIRLWNLFLQCILRKTC